MTTEDTLSSIDATLAGWYDRDTSVSDDAMRWTPTKSAELCEVVGTDADEGGELVMGALYCACGHLLNASVERTGNREHDWPAVDRALARKWEVHVHLRGVGSVSPVDGDRTYVENNTSREQEER